MVVQWLGLCASTAGGTGSIPHQGSRIPHGAPPPTPNDLILSLLISVSSRFKLFLKIT